MAAIGASSVSDGPVLSVINKRLRALRKKYNRILRMEEFLSQGKILNKEQEETLHSKASVMGCISELEKLKSPVCAALEKELKESEIEKKFSMVEDVIKLLYFATMFSLPRNWVPRNASSRERERCLAYTNVNGANAPELVSEMDLTLISMLGSLLISRPMNLILPHQNALQLCVEHARLWLSKSDQPIGSNPYVTYSGLREKLNKIMASDYFITTPEMKAPVEVAAAAGSYASFQVPMHGSTVSVDMPVQVEGSVVQYQQKEEEETANAEENESYDNQLSPVEEFDQGDENENFSELPSQNEPVMHQAEIGQNLQEFDPREQNYVPRRSYQGYRGGRGVGASGRRGFPNGRGGRGNGRGGAYQNGRNQYFDQAGNYHPRNNYYRGRGGRGFGGNYNYQAGYVVADS